MNDTWQTTEGPRRIRLAQQAMAQQRLEALFVAGPTNLVYLTGYPSAERTLARPFYLLVPRSGEPCLVVQNGRYEEARRYSWVTDVRRYSRLSVAPVDEIRAVLHGWGLGGGRIGAELGWDQRVNMPVGEFLRLREELHPFELVDASALLWNLRMRKSAAEIERIRRACQITAAAYERCFASLRGGMTEADSAAALRDDLVHHSRGDGWVILTSGTGNYELATAIAGPRVIEPGDMVWMDAGCSVGGYWSDFGRAGVVGGPSAEQREGQRLIHEATMAGIRLVRPGVPVAEIAFRCNRLMEEVALPVTLNISGVGGRVGHGLGLDVTEPPHISEQDPTVLEAGMCITVEPGVATAFGMFHVEENLVVTQDGYEILSNVPRELRTIPT